MLNLDTLLYDLLDSVVTLDLVVFFHQNPDSVDSLAGIALWTGHDPKRVEQEVPKLVGAGILERDGEGEEAVYLYTRDSRIRGVIEEFMANTYLDRKERMKLIARIMEQEVRRQWS